VIELVLALPAELDRVWITVIGGTNVHPALNGDKLEAALTVAVELEVCRTEQVDCVRVPALHLDDSPASDGRGLHDRCTDATGGEVDAGRSL